MSERASPCLQQTGKDENGVERGASFSLSTTRSFFMAQETDIGGKRLISLAPDGWPFSPALYWTVR